MTSISDDFLHTREGTVSLRRPGESNPELSPCGRLLPPIAKHDKSLGAGKKERGKNVNGPYNVLHINRVSSQAKPNEQITKSYYTPRFMVSRCHMCNNVAYLTLSPGLDHIFIQLALPLVRLPMSLRRCEWRLCGCG